ncbi:MAG TPA: deoxyguanosinetriphosphate triphosphohydrolase [Chthoniobacteraceae bacterium]|nr:deoxyguanosinetriphosphate triphosphohydrolase [Chthoniobacteraceae bacterium]
MSEPTVLRSREAMEEIERQLLAPYAQHSRDSRGRLHPETPHPYRTEYQRDGARIIHSQAFRRLEYKTQVFLSGTGDHLRTRLTHTMEVASIGRSIARSLGLNEYLTEAITLAHDLGHPPFGHSGEKTLDERMRGHGGFDHNAQSLRIVERIEKKYPHVDGLNLTYELLEGLQKHRKLFDPPFWDGAPLPEAEGRRERVEPYPSPSLEAQIADIADEIAYYSHDLDDGLEFHLITPAQLEEIDLWVATREEILSRYPDLEGRELFAYIIRSMIDRTVEDVIGESLRRLRAAGVRTATDVRYHPEWLIAYSAPMAASKRRLRRFLYQQIYFHPDIREVNDRCSALLRELFDAYLEHPEWLGETSARRIPEDGLHRVVCDYLSGMTDRYLLEEYERRLGPV